MLKSFGICCFYTCMKPVNYFWYYRPSIINPFTLIADDEQYDFFYFCSVIPESFRWYVAHDRPADAQKIIERWAKINSKPVPDIGNTVIVEKPSTQETHKKYTFIHLFKSKKLAKITLLLAVDWYVFYYPTDVIRNSVNVGFPQLIPGYKHTFTMDRDPNLNLNKNGFHMCSIVNNLFGVKNLTVIYC